MVLQENQVQRYVSKGELKTYLLIEKTKFYRCLNQQLGIYLAVNTKSILEESTQLEINSAIVVTSTHGVKVQYYQYDRIINKNNARSEVVTETERIRKIVQTYYKEIKRELYMNLFNSLVFVLSEERAKTLINCPNVDTLTNKAFNDYSTITSFEEREQLRNMGIQIVILELIR